MDVCCYVVAVLFCLFLFSLPFGCCNFPALGCLVWFGVGVACRRVVYHMRGVEKVVVERYDVVGDSSNELYVPKTSASASATLGTEDTPSSFTNDPTMKKPVKGGSKFFASLFHDNQNPSKGMTLHKVDFDEFEVEVFEDKVDDVVQAWGHALVGYVVGGFPGMDVINKLRNS